MKLSFLFRYLFIILIVLSAMGVGFRFGKYIGRNKKNQKNISLGLILNAMLTFFGFILALTLSTVSSRYATRKQLILDEANTLNKAILRTDFLEEPLRSQSRQLLIEYVDIRVQGAKLKGKEISKLVADSEILHNQLWILANQASNQNQTSKYIPLYIQSLNEVIDLHSKRFYQGIYYRLPPTFWFFLYFMTILTMLGVGYEFGINNSGNFLGPLLLILIFSTVVFIISDLDQPLFKALIPINQQPMLDLQQKLKDSVN